MGLKWSVFLIGPIYLIGMWFGEDQRATYHKGTCIKEIGSPLEIPNNHYAFNSEHDWEDLCI